LKLVLYPAEAATDAPVDLRIEQLRPGTRYNATGALKTSITADAQGNATLQVALHGRTPIVIAPVL
jgi:hypothetical protein